MVDFSEFSNRIIDCEYDIVDHCDTEIEDAAMDNYNFVRLNQVDRQGGFVVTSKLLFGGLYFDEYICFKIISTHTSHNSKFEF